MKLKPQIHSAQSQDVITQILQLGELCHGQEDIGRVLDLLVENIAKIMQSDVSSLYLIDTPSQYLVLRATKGLKKEAIGVIKMRVGEGLVGKTLEWLKPVSLSTAKRSRSFKFFPETGEEAYSSFLSVPLIYNRHPIGVLVVQNQKAQRYSSRSVHLLMTLAIPAVSVIEKAKLLGTFDTISNRQVKDGQARRADGDIHHAIGASPGIAVAPVCILKKSAVVPNFSEMTRPLHAKVEKMRVLEAFRWVEEELRSTQDKAKNKFGLEELSIFDAYKMVIESTPFKDQILAEIDKGHSALQSVELVISQYADELTRADDEYIRERVFDVQDVGRKITDHLLFGGEVPKLHHPTSGENILLAEFWSISDLIELDLEKTRGILSPTGGATSHIAILAESLGLPAVLGLSRAMDYMADGDLVIMDGSSGIVIVNPTSEVRATYKKESQAQGRAQQKYQKQSQKAVRPKGGKQIVVGANMGMIAHIKDAIKNGAEEIGLYRTEFPFLIRRSMPTEVEQFRLYQKVLHIMGNRMVTFRTLDIGGDKYLPYLRLPHEANPFLGWRSIRLSLEREDLFSIQLRALLRASKFGSMRLLFPMITTIEEIRQIKIIVADVIKELRSSKVSVAPSIPLGIMIEVPAAVEIADHLIKEVDFFSLGTNDLIQYTLAVDRSNPKVANLYNPLHPAVLRSIQRLVAVTQKAKKHLSVCGEMASDPYGIMLLLGMGITGLSMSPPFVSKMKSFIGSLVYDDLTSLAAKALQMDSAQKIESLLENHIRTHGLEEYLPYKSRHF